MLIAWIVIGILIAIGAFAIIIGSRMDDYRNKVENIGGGVILIIIALITALIVASSATPPETPNTNTIELIDNIISQLEELKWYQ